MVELLPVLRVDAHTRMRMHARGRGRGAPICEPPLNPFAVFSTRFLLKKRREAPKCPRHCSSCYPGQSQVSTPPAMCPRESVPAM